MTTISDLLPLDGRDLVWLLEMSTDNFATVAYRWGTHSCDATVAAVSGFYEARILKVGNVSRSFGTDHLPVASATEVQLDNTDFSVDFLVAQSTVETQVFKARFRLSIALSDTSANVYQSNLLTQQVGTFVCLDMPRREDGRVILSLADDTLGQLEDLVVPPTVNDWFNAFNAGTETTAPFDTDPVQNKPDPLFDWNAPTAIQFGGAVGDTPFFGFPMCTFRTTRGTANFDTGFFPAARRSFIYPILVLATRRTDAITAAEVTGLIGAYRSDVIRCPQTERGARAPIPSTSNGLKIWKAYKTDSLTSTGPDGANYTWSILWIAIDLGAYASWKAGVSVTAGSGAVPVNNQTVPIAPEFDFAAWAPGAQYPDVPPPPACNGMFAAFEVFGVIGQPGSQITDVFSGPSLQTYAGSPASIIQDLVQYYSIAGSGAVDTTRFAKAKLAGRYRVRGEIIPESVKPSAGQVLSTSDAPFGVGTLRKALAELAASSDYDVFCTMAGQVALVSQGADFDTQTTTFPAVDESRMANVRERIPSVGERWAPYNRVYVQRKAPPFALKLAGNEGLRGPFDNPTAISAWGRIITRIIHGKWWQTLQRYPSLVIPNAGGVPLSTATSVAWSDRNLEAKVRGILEFTTDVGILALDLGDYFTTSWTRGGSNSAYASALFRIESMTIRPEKGEVDVSAVWMGDLQTQQPYLLDSELLVVRAANGGATLTVTDGSSTVVRSAGSFVTDAVAAGDIFRVRDSAEAATAFLRNKDVRVVSVTDATHVVVSSSVWTPAGAHVVAAADWTMLRGATTYPDAVSDPANYPSGGAMYGKVTNSAGVFGNAAAGNFLMDG